MKLGFRLHLRASSRCGCLCEKEPKRTTHDQWQITNGYPQEIQDFVDAIREDREPLAGIELAVECTEVIYAASLSAAEGRRVELKR
jgi:predicted dehydrogenase